MSFTGCPQAQDPTCINGVNPYDFTRWAYVSTTPSSPDTASVCSSSSGDPYLGMVVNTCECDSENNGNGPTPPSYNGVEYLPFHRDCPTFAGGTCVGTLPNGVCQIGDCGTKSYSGCPDMLCGSAGTDNAWHYWWVRDWNTELATQESQAKCCALSSTDADRTKQCPPSMWSGSTTCIDVMKGWCKNGWDGTCDDYMTDALNNGNISNATTVFVSALDEWSKTASQSSVQPNDQFLPALLKWCNAPGMEGVCNSYLQTGCSNTTSSDISNDNTGVVGKVCGCYLPTDQYYLPGVIPPECNGTCGLAPSVGGIPYYEYTSSGYQPRTCQQSTCVMDNATVDFINSQGGDVNFEEMCGGCQGAECTCVMNGVNITSVNSVLGGVELDQVCGVCPDTTTGVAGGCSVEGYKEDKSSFHLTLLLFLLVIAGVIVLGDLIR